MTRWQRAGTPTQTNYKRYWNILYHSDPISNYYVYKSGISACIRYVFVWAYLLNTNTTVIPLSRSS
jgi:hypothetical protein